MFASFEGRNGVTKPASALKRAVEVQCIWPLESVDLHALHVHVNSDAIGTLDDLPALATEALADVARGDQIIDFPFLLGAIVD